MIYQLGDRRVQAEGECFVADNAAVIGSVILKHQASVWFSAVLRGDLEPITIGEGSNIQDCAVIHTDMGYPAVIGRDVTVGHHAMLHGCTIGDNSLIGINSVVLNGAKIGDNCIIGANSLVTENKVIPDNSLVVGSPGKVVREIPTDQEEWLREQALIYQERSSWFLKDLSVQGQADATS
jgi:carbonic anhydrase/acetyltransferase-like protein (isoleucine patch superfamily)